MLFRYLKNGRAPSPFSCHLLYCWPIRMDSSWIHVAIDNLKLRQQQRNLELEESS
jgi:hypothetical protein